MSTRSTINFGYGSPSNTGENKPTAKIYRHSDGYPEGVLPDLKRFFTEVEDQTRGGYSGSRFNDPSYLAAKFVVWQAGEYARDPEKPLEFLSVGVLDEDPGDIAFTYWIDCSVPFGAATSTHPTVYVSVAREADDLDWKEATAWQG